MKKILVDAVDAFVVETENGFEIFKPMQKMLDEFPNTKIILTGANDEQFKKFGLDKMPYEVFTLKHDPEKTDPEYFKKFLNQYNLTANDVVYFEHNSAAVESAESLGIVSYFYDNAIQDLDTLKNFLDKELEEGKSLAVGEGQDITL